MCRFVPLGKTEAKSSKGPITEKRRGDWGGLSRPVTRREENPRAYRRCRRKTGGPDSRPLSRIEDRMG